MNNGAEVLTHLLPNGGWVIYGDDFDSIIYDEGIKPITKKQFNDTLDKIDEIIAEKQAIKIAEKDAILSRIGLTAEEAALILG